MRGEFVAGMSDKGWSEDYSEVCAVAVSHRIGLRPRDADALFAVIRFLSDFRAKTDRRSKT